MSIVSADLPWNPGHGSLCRRHEHIPHGRLLPTWGSESSGEGCGVRWAARGLRLGLREVPQNRVDDFMVDDERYDPHLAVAVKADHRIDLAGPFSDNPTDTCLSITPKMMWY